MKTTEITLEEMKRFAHLAESLAKEAIGYLEQGYSPDQITSIFARFFTDYFKINLTEDALAKMPRGGNGQAKVDRETGAREFSLEFAIAFMAAVNQTYKNQ